MSPQLEPLLGLIFDAITDDTALPMLAAQLAASVGGFSAMATAGRAGETPRLQLGYGAFAEVAPLYSDYWHARDPWVMAWEQVRPRGLLNLERILPAEEFERSEIWNDLLLRSSGIFRSLGFVSDLPGGERLVFGLHRTRTQASYEPVDEEALADLPAVLTHLVLARRRAAESAGAIAQRLVDAESDAVVVVSRDGAVRYANAAAQRLGAAAPARIEQGRLVAGPLTSATELARAIAWACTGRGGRSFDSGAGHSMSVDPLPGDGGLACVRVSDLSARRADALSAAQARHGLTVAEAALAASLLDGRSVAQHALTRGVSLATARTQVRALFAKMGVRRQVELVQALQALLPR